VEEHPEYYIPGTELDLARAPQNYTWAKRPRETPHVTIGIPCLATYTRAHAPYGGCGISDMCTDYRATRGRAP
jgi:hypothetical protein